jgi:hypothetical protein
LAQAFFVAASLAPCAVTFVLAAEFSAAGE